MRSSALFFTIVLLVVSMTLAAREHHTETHHESRHHERAHSTGKTTEEKSKATEPHRRAHHDKSSNVTAKSTPIDYTHYLYTSLGDKDACDCTSSTCLKQELLDDHQVLNSAVCRR